MKYIDNTYIDYIELVAVSVYVYRHLISHTQIARPRNYLQMIEIFVPVRDQTRDRSAVVNAPTVSSLIIVSQ